MGRPFPCLLASLVPCAVAAPAQEQHSNASHCLVAEYHEHSEWTIDEDGPGPKPATLEKSDVKLIVSFGARRFAVQSAGELRVWDFDAGVIREIDRAAGTYTEVSVLHEVAFVQVEMRNRMKLREALHSAAIDA